MTQKFEVNSPNVIHETIDGEVIVIDLTSGTYYSLRGPGAAVWEAVQAGGGEADAVAAVSRLYDGDADAIGTAVGGLLTRLEEERLVRRTEGVAAAAVPAVGEEPGTRLPFEPPVLEKHTDMQDLILIDPVHEVDARGWPHAAGAEADR